MPDSRCAVVACSVRGDRRSRRPVDAFDGRVGVAQVVEDGRFTTAGQVAGTPGYLSPELLAGDEPGPRDDWWGWAAVLAFAATGRPPFGIRPLAVVLARVSSGRPDLAGLDPRVAAVLAGALAVEAEDRTPPGDVVAALRRIAEQGPEPTPGAAPDTTAGSTQVLGAGGTRVLEAARGTPGGPAAIQAEMDRISASREASQPLRSKTGGSTFKNPPENKAWQLVDSAGCRGLTIGGAQVSEKHTNFLINLGNASSADIEALGEEVRRRVYANSGVDLNWEIQRVGRLATGEQK